MTEWDLAYMRRNVQVPLPPLPEPVHGFYAAHMFTADQKHAHAAAVSAADNADIQKLYLDAVEQAAANADEVLRLREQLHLAEVARAAQVDGLAQGAGILRDERDALRAEVAGLREALLQCGESGSIFDVRSIVRGALAAGKGEA